MTENSNPQGEPNPISNIPVNPQPTPLPAPPMPGIPPLDAIKEEEIDFEKDGPETIPEKKDKAAYIAYLITTKLSPEDQASLHDSVASAIQNNKPLQTTLHIVFWKGIKLLEQKGLLEGII